MSRLLSLASFAVREFAHWAGCIVVLHTSVMSAMTTCLSVPSPIVVPSLLLLWVASMLVLIRV